MSIYDAVILINININFYDKLLLTCMSECLIEASVVVVDLCCWLLEEEEDLSDEEMMETSRTNHSDDDCCCGMLAEAVFQHCDSLIET